VAIDLFDGVQLIGEAALSTATGSCGVWGSGSAADPSLWGSALWGPDESFVDILKAADGTKLLRSLTTDRGFSDEVRRWESGTATVKLTNYRGMFSSTNLSGPFVVAGISGIRPMVPVRFRATYKGVTYPIYRGYVDPEWRREYDQSNADGVATAPCTDEWARLANAGGIALGSPTGAGELFGPRVHRILNAAGNSGARVVDVGTTAMQATDLSSKAGDELAKIVDAEGGAIYIEADGSVVAERQYALIENARSIVVQGVFGDGPGELPYSDERLSTSAAQVVNIVSYQRVGGVAQVRSDAVSRALYKDKTDPKTDLICTTDAQADTLAAWKLARFREPEDRFTEITIRPRHAVYGPRLWPHVLGRRVRDLIQVIRRYPGEDAMVRYCHIAGIHHEISPDDWVTTWRLSSATPYVQFANSRWDIGTWGSASTDSTAARWFY
jgi:hypothetical protein